MLIHFQTIISHPDNQYKKIVSAVILELKYNIFAAHLVQHFPEKQITSLIDFINEPTDFTTLKQRILNMRSSVTAFHKHQSFPKIDPSNNIYNYLEALKNSTNDK